jgi:hypothetical protein
MDIKTEPDKPNLAGAEWRLAQMRIKNVSRMRAIRLAQFWRDSCEQNRHSVKFTSTKRPLRCKFVIYFQ